MDRKRLRTVGLAALIGLAYYLETQTLGLFLQCPFHQLTGLYCPGCGLTTACIALLQGDFAGAAAANFGLMISLPVLAPILLFCLWRWLHHRPVAPCWGRWALGVGGAYFVVWGVLRNLP